MVISPGANLPPRPWVRCQPARDGSSVQATCPLSFRREGGVLIIASVSTFLFPALLRLLLLLNFWTDPRWCSGQSIDNTSVICLSSVLVIARPIGLLVQFRAVQCDFKAVVNAPRLRPLRGSARLPCLKAVALGFAARCHLPPLSESVLTLVVIACTWAYCMYPPPTTPQLKPPCLCCQR